jgi:YhcH/YjgK/YiaL family protein
VILAPLADRARYAPLHPLFAQAFAWCDVAANRERADGRYDIIPGRLAVIVESGETKPRAIRRFESHRANIDIQLNLAGPEAMEWTPVDGLRVEDDFAPDGDIAFYAEPARPITRLLVPPGHFAVFWPEDAHKPVLHPEATPVPYRKLVFKVAVAG